MEKIQSDPTIDGIFDSGTGTDITVNNNIDVLTIDFAIEVSPSCESPGMMARRAAPMVK